MIDIYGFFYVDDAPERSLNFRESTESERLSVYLKNAGLLTNSLLFHGIKFTLLTNNKDRIAAIARSAQVEIDIRQVPIALQVPSGTRFRSAHFKIDALRYFATRDSRYSVLLDIDVVCLRPIPEELLLNAKLKRPMLFDISYAERQAFGGERLRRDLELISMQKGEGRWYGGEFIAGPSCFFQDLVCRIESMFERYIEVIPKLHHVGDEAIVSAAISAMHLDGLVFSEAGSVGVIERYWNARTLHCQASFEAFEGSFLLHLPADKAFLAASCMNPFPGGVKFLDSYKRERRLYRRLLRKLR
ncbi:hypothetical protein [Crateriforma conspicua]|uniref:Glycosyl transferase family 8 n=1 Tax=Crateriforma conspicua TaxID=2527996 RepID=A0A5C5XSC7_9PLAN|nr:hypothetical protein [Crateriforma conspicua]TWT65558.1 hypothetical protein Pan14r_51050 [Crateriforma conspicua]